MLKRKGAAREVSDEVIAAVILQDQACAAWARYRAPDGIGGSEWGGGRRTAGPGLAFGVPLQPNRISETVAIKSDLVKAFMFVIVPSSCSMNFRRERREVRSVRGRLFDSELIDR